jgi:hypothetical protein
MVALVQLRSGRLYLLSTFTLAIGRRKAAKLDRARVPKRRHATTLAALDFPGQDNRIRQFMVGPICSAVGLAKWNCYRSPRH